MTRTMRSANNRRLTKPMVCSEDRSSHWASSTSHSTGWCWAAMANEVEHRDSDEDAIGRRAGTEPEHRLQRLPMNDR